ncbi:MAG: MATE family efflux transporter [Lachnospiraceae bacterium]|nr:MATE family efflux transporter [Lachnospiraceae bacterium]
MKQTNDNSYFATAPIGGLIAKFAIPTCLSLIVVALYNIVDQIFIGQGVGYLGNGATSVIFPFTCAASALALLVGDGAASFLSLKLGENHKKDAAKGVGNAITVLVILGVTLLVIGLVALRPLSRVFGATDTLMPYVLDYGYPIIIGLPFLVILTGLNSIIRADGSPKFAMLTMLAGAVINCILDPLFIFVFHWGVWGAGVATAAGQIISFIISIRYLFHCKNIKLEKHGFILRGEIVTGVLKLGVSSFITQISIVIVVILSNNLLAKYGASSKYGAEIPLTAIGIVMKINQILVALLVGIAAGAQPIVGYNYGAEKYDRVKKTFKLSVLMAAIVGTIGFVLFECCPQVLVNIFGSESELYMEFCIKSFRIFLCFCILTSFQIVSGIFLQAIGQPVKAAIVSLSRQIIFFIPAVLILPRFMGVEGILWAAPVGDGLSFLVSIFFIITEMRKLKNVEGKEKKHK